MVDEPRMLPPGMMVAVGVRARRGVLINTDLVDHVESILEPVDTCCINLEPCVF